MADVVINYSIPKELKVIPKMSSYSSISEFVDDAINTLLAARKDLRVNMACNYIRKIKSRLRKRVNSQK